MRDPNQLLDAASHEILRSGYVGASLSAIAGRLDLTKGALVRQFPTKEHLAQGIIARLREAIDEEQQRSFGVYPRSGIRAMVRFLLALGIRSQTDPQIAAAVVLFADRASPQIEVAELYEAWVRALLVFLERARDAGELTGDTSDAVLAEYIFITNIGAAVFGSRGYAPGDETPRLRFLRFTLNSIGVVDADALIDEVFATGARGSLPSLPPRSGVARPRPDGEKRDGGQRA